MGTLGFPFPPGGNLILGTKMGMRRGLRAFSGRGIWLRLPGRNPVVEVYAWRLLGL
jgi:hypothetical protein